MPRNRRSMRKMTNGYPVQQLIHPASLGASTGASSVFTANNFSIIANRPARPRLLEVEFFSAQPRSFTILMQGGNAEEIWRSPLLLSGPIPRRRRYQMPTSTDFALYAGTETVLTVFHSASSGLVFAFNLGVEYKFATLGTFV